jgi:hypothetical protein
MSYAQYAQALLPSSKYLVHLSLPSQLANYSVGVEEGVARDHITRCPGCWPLLL